MKNYLKVAIICWLTICFCVSCKTISPIYGDVSFSSYNVSSDSVIESDPSSEQPLDVIARSLLEDTANQFGLNDRIIENIGFLVKAEWSQSGEEVIISYLNDNAIYENGDRISLPFTGEIYGKYAKGNSNAYEVEAIIEQINLGVSNAKPLMRFEIKDLIITLDFSNGHKVIFDSYYEELVKHSDGTPGTPD